MIISKLEKGAGFFSQLFFSINHYIYARKNNMFFLLDTDEWLYKYKKGWDDYFETPYLDLDNIQTNVITNNTATFFDVLEDYPISDYKIFIKDYYQYNDTIKKMILFIKEFIGLSNKEYGAIYIRRGDKLFSESKLINAKDYINLLLEKYPECKIVYIQSDDYTSYEELEEYIQEHRLDIELKTLCNKNQRGTLVSYAPNIFITELKENEEYLNKIRSTLHKTTEIINMCAEELYQNTVELIVGIDIVLHSKVCVIDYQSNVSRFIKLAHKDYDNVYEVTGKQLDLSIKKCPSYGFDDQ